VSVELTISLLKTLQTLKKTTLRLKVHKQLLIMTAEGKLCACKPEYPAVLPPGLLVCREASRQKIVCRVQKKVKKHWSTPSINHYCKHYVIWVCYVFTGRCLVAASNNAAQDSDCWPSTSVSWLTTSNL
jgi:hypothetical protein